jgi:hypothetical protein
VRAQIGALLVLRLVNTRPDCRAMAHRDGDCVAEDANIAARQAVKDVFDALLLNLEEKSR